MQILALHIEARNSTLALKHVSIVYIRTNSTWPWKFSRSDSSIKIELLQFNKEINKVVVLAGLHFNYDNSSVPHEMQFPWQTVPLPTNFLIKRMYKSTGNLSWQKGELIEKDLLKSLAFFRLALAPIEVIST